VIALARFEFVLTETAIALAQFGFVVAETAIALTLIEYVVVEIAIALTLRDCLKSFGDIQSQTIIIFFYAFAFFAVSS